MNATNRPVDFLLNTENAKPTQSPHRGRASGPDVSALKEKENSFGDVYRQQRGEEARVKQKSESSQPQEKALNRHERAQPEPTVAAQYQQTEGEKTFNGKALPPQQAVNAPQDQSTDPAGGYESSMNEEAEPALMTDITVNWESLEVTKEKDNTAEQAGTDLSLEVPGEEILAAAADTEATLNLSVQVTSKENTPTDIGARTTALASSVPDILKELKQNRLGEAPDEMLKTEVKNGQQAKPLTGAMLEQKGSIASQDRFAQMPLGQEFKLLREQINLDMLNTNGEKILASDPAKAADALPRLNALAQSMPSLGPARPGTVTANVQPAVGSTDWGPAMAQRIVWLANRGISAAELQLNPRELGPVDVRINVNGEQTSIHFTSPHVAVREVLESSVMRLREMLENSGVNLVDVDVSDQSASEQAQTGARGSGVADQGDEEAEGEVVAQTLRRIESDSLVDFYA